jgi:hypothetical protein
VVGLNGDIRHVPPRSHKRWHRGYFRVLRVCDDHFPVLPSTEGLPRYHGKLLFVQEAAFLYDRYRVPWPLPEKCIKCSHTIRGGPAGTLWIKVTGTEDGRGSATYLCRRCCSLITLGGVPSRLPENRWLDALWEEVAPVVNAYGYASEQAAG